MMRASSFTFALLAALFFAPSIAQADVESCANAAERSERSLKQEHLLEARSQLPACLATSCPRILRETCGQMLRDVEAAIPSIVVAAKEGARDITDATFKIDGKSSTEAGQGKIIELDPGQHVVEATRRGKTVRSEFVARNGEKRRNVILEFPAPAPPIVTTTTTRPRSDDGASAPSSTKPHAPKWVGFAFVGLGAVGLGSFGYFAITSKNDVNEMERSCRPFCDDSQIDSARTKALVADISLGVGIVALLAGAYFLVVDR